MKHLLRSSQNWLWRLARWFDMAPSQQDLLPGQVDWIIPNWLALGGMPEPGDSYFLAQAKIQVVLSLCAPVEGTLPDDILENFQCDRIILPDSTYRVPLQVEQLAVAVELVHQCILEQKPVYVHCLVGVQRSPTVCIAYLCKYHQLDLRQALNRVRKARPQAMPTPQQLAVVQELLDWC